MTSRIETLTVKRDELFTRIRDCRKEIGNPAKWARNLGHMPVSIQARIDDEKSMVRRFNAIVTELRELRGDDNED